MLEMSTMLVYMNLTWSICIEDNGNKGWLICENHVVNFTSSLRVSMSTLVMTHCSRFFIVSSTKYGLLAAWIILWSSSTSSSHKSFYSDNWPVSSMANKVELVWSNFLFCQLILLRGRSDTMLYAGLQGIDSMSNNFVTTSSSSLPSPTSRSTATRQRTWHVC